MASPQWKTFQPPVQDPAILAFESAAATGNLPITAPAFVPSNTTNNMSQAIRETGIIEKLLHSYGFVQCCDREARLFFHFSEYSGNASGMKVGEPVEFQMSYDRRTGKPIAVSLIRLEPGSVSCEVLSEERVIGNVVTEAKPCKTKNNNPNQDNLGRVSFERSGEFFYIPFALEDGTDNQKIKAGDQVSFFIATDKRNGNVRARKIEIIQHVKAERFQGVVCSMKDAFGFIERADVVKEIFFHYSEFKGDINELMLGDDVEFSVQSRNNKDVATEIVRLADGTVIFEDVALDRKRGRVQKTLRTAHGRRQSDPLAGRIVYETIEGPIEIPYGDKDQKGDYTLQPSDIVEFNIATDRRDKLQRATNILLVEDTFKVNGEKRETGVIASVKDGFGFLRCAEREARMFFHFSEMLDPSKEVKQGEEVAFTIIQDPTSPNRQIAIRIKYLPKGTVSFDITSDKKYVGVVEKEPSSHKQAANMVKNKEPDPGIIMYDVEGTKQTIPFGSKAVQGACPTYGDKVEFQISESHHNQTKTAVNVSVMTKNIGTRLQGFIATLKDNFGFIETADHNKEVFFHFSAFEGDPGELDLGDEVEYVLSKKTAKVSAETIKKLPKGSVAPEEVQKGHFDGKIIRCMRIVNPEQDEYPGLVQVGVEDEPGAITYEYGITSLADKRDFLQKGDIVKFQVSVVKGTGKKRAVNVAAMRKYIRAKVDSIKGQFGFLNHEVEGGKKLFFHMSEVHDGIELHPGDEVEFVVVQNQRNGKYSACSLRKITDRQRPERLVSRLKSMSEDGPRVQAVRQPRGPDGTKGFKQERIPWVKSA